MAFEPLFKHTTLLTSVKESLHYYVLNVHDSKSYNYLPILNT